MESESSLAVCPVCQGVYDGTGIKLDQKITCPYCSSVISHEVRFADFVLKKKMGVGGTCTVYLAHDLQTHQEVALKILNDSLARDPEGVKQFLHEATVTATLKFPNIVSVYRCGEHQGKYFISMELLMGGSFDDRIVKEGIVPEIDCLRIGIQAAQGLQYASARGLLHRDVKPGNILFDSQGRVKMVDFGLSHRRGGANPNTGEIWGTAYYVPPERLDGLNEDLRSDIYGLAASLYHGLTGRPPYSSADSKSDSTTTQNQTKRSLSSRISTKVSSLFSHAAANQQNNKLGQMRKINPKIFLRTTNAIEKALAPNPKDRFQSYGDFIKAMEDAITWGPKRQVGPEPRSAQPK